MLPLLKSIERGIDAVIRRVAFTALAGMILTITLQIIFRVLFDALVWSEEVARYLLVWTTFLGAALAYQRGRHIAVTFLVDAIPRKAGTAVRLFAYLAAIVFFAVVLVVGVRYMRLQSFQVSASLRIPMPIVYAVIPISALIMLYYAVLDAIELLVEPAPTVEA